MNVYDGNEQQHSRLSRTLRQEASDAVMEDQTHPPDVDLARYADTGLATPTLITHVEGCVTCCQLLGEYAEFAEPSTADELPIQTLITEQRQTALTRQIFEQFNSPPSKPSPGQVWQLHWGNSIALALVVEVHDGGARVWPASLGTEQADQEATIIPSRHSPFADELAVWPHAETEVAWFVLNRLFGSLRELDPNQQHQVLAQSGPFATWAPGQNFAPTDARKEFAAELFDTFESLSAAAWRDPAWEASTDLTSLLQEGGFTAQWLADTLELSAREAVSLYRGGRSPTADEQQTLADAIGRTVGTVRPDSRVLSVLEAPSLRPLIREVAAAANTDELSLRRELATFKAAARQFEARRDRDVESELRLELLRRLESVTGSDHS